MELSAGPVHGYITAILRVPGKQQEKLHKHVAKHVRSSYFTAGNTTTNRLEASWRQMKRLLNLTTTLDKCLAGIFLYQNTIMRNLRRELIENSYSLHYDPMFPSEIQDIGDAASIFVFKTVYDEFVRFKQLKAHMGVIEQDETHAVVLNRSGTRFRCRLDASHCNCQYFATFRLPCAHVMFIVLEELGIERLPASMVAERWLDKRSESLIPVLKASITLNETLREMCWIRGGVGSSAPHSDVPGCKLSISPARPRIKYTKLKKSEPSSSQVVVRSDVEKFNIAMAIFQPLLDELVTSSSLDFYRKIDLVSVACSDLRSALQGLSIADS